MRELKRGVRIVGEREQRGMLKIGDVSKRSGVGVEALRFYEHGGLLNKPARTHTGYRVYDEDVLERLSFIRRAQGLGLSLDEIKRIIDQIGAGLNPCGEVREIVRRRVAELDERLREMERYRRELKTMLDDWDKAGESSGHVCGLIEGSSVEHAARPRREGLKKAAQFFKWKHGNQRI